MSRSKAKEQLGAGSSPVAAGSRSLCSQEKQVWHEASARGAAGSL